MKSSHSSGLVGAAVEELAGERAASAAGRLAADFADSGAAGLAGAGCEHDATDDRVGDRRIAVQPAFEAGADDPFDEGGDLGIVEFVLGLAHGTQGRCERPTGRRRRLPACRPA